MATASQWLHGARPRTLPAALSPVIVGTAAAWWLGGFNAVHATLALVVALALQVGVNYANDYSDGVRGTDDNRPTTGGPVRLVGQRLAAPSAVRTAAMLSFLVAAIAGLTVVVLTEQWWLLLVGAASIAAAWFYTGGTRPYGYAGFGEAFVFVFFGVVAVTGTTYVQTETLSPLSLTLSVAMGSFACAILVANNLRDRAADEVSGKKTLAVRLGDGRTRTLYVALTGIAIAIPVLVSAVGAATGNWPLLAGLAVVAGLAMKAPVRAVLSGALGRDLVAVLAATGKGQLLSAVLIAIGLIVSKGL